MVSSHQNVNLIAYPTSDWSMIQRITTRFMSKSPRVSLKILGFVIMTAHRWWDIHLVKKFKQDRPPCGHDMIFCQCSLLFLEQTNYERPFSPSIVLERKHNRFLQVPNALEVLLVNTGLKVSSVICADSAQKTYPPKDIQ